METIYLDYNATTPIDPQVAQAMRPYLDQYFGNPSSMHQFGIETKNAIKKARKQVADLLGVDSSEIIFTSGGTESNNFAIKGYALANREKGNHIITSQIEHPAVIEVCKYLETQGFKVTYCPVDENGIIKLDELEKAILPSTILITIMHANNEVGSIQPISEISRIAKKNNIKLHTDAAQSLGKINTKVNELGVDLLTVAGHKLYAPKGIGALFIRSGIKLEKIIHGADHEQNMRAGTENVLEIVGLGKACELANQNLEKNKAHLKGMRDLLYSKINESGLNVKRNGHEEKCLPNTLSLSFKDVEANTLLSELNEVAASAGAACHAYGVDVSSVLSAMKIPIDYAMGTIRFSTGKYNSKQEIELAASKIIEVATKLQTNTENIKFEAKQEIKLTQFTHGMGCTCKLRPQDLELILKDFPFITDKNILVGNNNSDDAAVYKINDELAVVQTVDFFTPIVDDPYQFGAIAAANALSDIYAMGAKPLFALNIVGFPSNRLPLSILNDILKGANDKAKEAGISIIGGHTVEDTEPKYGLVVMGTIHPDKIFSNNKAKLGDDIILTKPIGTGVYSTALKQGLLNKNQENELISSMSQLNNISAELLGKHNVHTCTDVTGFGLIGHLREVLKASELDAVIQVEDIPIFTGVKEFISEGIIPGGTQNNKLFNDPFCLWENISEVNQLLLNDAQTSGGLLIFVDKSLSPKLLNELHNLGNKSASIIGQVMQKGTGKVSVQ
jgi:cysteine desulfurase